MSGAEATTLSSRRRTEDKSALSQLCRDRWGYLAGIARRAGAGADADDIVAEAFAKTLHAVQNGRGPSRSVLGYLTTTVRSLVYSRPTGPPAHNGGAGLDDEATVHPWPDLAERILLRAALADVPGRMRDVLLYVELDGHETPELAASLGITKQAAASLVYRAREALRVSYLAQHCPSPTDKATHPSSTQLARHVRGCRPQGRRVSDHLAACSVCRARWAALVSVNEGLRARSATALASVNDGLQGGLESFGLPAAGA